MDHEIQDGSALNDATELEVELMARADRILRYIQTKIPLKYQALIAPEDVLQEVWIAAYSGYANYVSARPDGFDRWLIGIANHKLIDFLKSAGRKKRGGHIRIDQAGYDRSKSLADLFGHVPAAGRTPSREVAAGEAARAVQMALEQLPEERRLAIQMRHLEGCSLAEIGRRMQKSEAAVHSILFRGLKDLRARLGKLTKFFSDAGSSTGGK